MPTRQLYWSGCRSRVSVLSQQAPTEALFGLRNSDTCMAGLALTGQRSGPDHVFCKRRLYRLQGQSNESSFRRHHVACASAVAAAALWSASRGLRTPAAATMEGPMAVAVAAVARWHGRLRH
eukprot:4778860-Pleurochrysis_carterae.AAC.1